MIKGTPEAHERCRVEIAVLLPDINLPRPDCYRAQAQAFRHLADVTEDPADFLRIARSLELYAETGYAGTASEVLSRVAVKVVEKYLSFAPEGSN